MDPCRDEKKKTPGDAEKADNEEAREMKIHFRE
jgi:hypothetical protein